MLYIIVNFIRMAVDFFTAAEPTAAPTAAEPTAETAPALGWESVDTSPDRDWMVIEFDRYECEDFVVVLGDREYMTYSRVRRFATVKNRSNRGGWAEFTGRIDLVRHYRNGYCVGTKAVLAGGTALHTFQTMVGQGFYNDVQNCTETIQFLNW